MKMDRSDERPIWFANGWTIWPPTPRQPKADGCGNAENLARKLETGAVGAPTRGVWRRSVSEVDPEFGADEVGGRFGDELSGGPDGVRSGYVRIAGVSQLVQERPSLACRREAVDERDGA